MRVRRLPRTIGRIVNSLRFADGRRGLRYRVLPTVEHQALLRALAPDLVVDVGANRGQFSLDVRRAAPHAAIIAFEPLDLEAMIYRSVHRRTRSILHEVALGSVPGQATFHVSAARDSSSLLPIGPRQGEIFAGTEEVSTKQVEVRLLDDYAHDFRTVAHRQMLKLDVQGAELDVLKGGSIAIGIFRWVYLEMSFIELYERQPVADEIIAYLRMHGFEIRGVGVPSVSDGVSVQVDALFERRQVCL